MSSDTSRRRVLQDLGVSNRVKLSALWVAVMFLFIYVDYFALYIPGHFEDMAAGNMGWFEVSQGVLLGTMALMAVPSLMIFLTVGLAASLSRWLNVIVAVLYIVVVVSGMVGETWGFYLAASSVEIVLLLLVGFYAIRWPKAEG